MRIKDVITQDESNFLLILQQIISPHYFYWKHIGGITKLMRIWILMLEFKAKCDDTLWHPTTRSWSFLFFQWYNSLYNVTLQKKKQKFSSLLCYLDRSIFPSSWSKNQTSVNAIHDSGMSEFLLLKLVKKLKKV